MILYEQEDNSIGFEEHGGAMMREISELKNELYEQLLSELPVLRARLGITQEMLAVKVGCSRQTVNAIEKRKKALTWQLFMAIITVFNLDDSTRKMLNDISGFNEKLNMVLKEEIDR